MVMTVILEGQTGEPPTQDDLIWWHDQFNLTHPVIDGTDIHYGINSYPHFLVLDQNMLCRYKQGGYNQNAIINWIETLLNDPPTPAWGDTATPGPPTATPTPTPTPTQPPPPTFTPVDTATPAPTDTPPPTLTPTPTPEGSATAPPPPTDTPAGGFEGVKLTLSKNYFRYGDEFLLSAEADSQSSNQGDFYCALDVFGAYYFYPSCEQTLDYKPLDLPAPFAVLRPFTWPHARSPPAGLAFTPLPLPR